MSGSAGGSRLFHTIVVMGLSFGASGCGGQTAVTAAGDAGGDARGSTGDATSASDATGASDVAVGSGDAVSLDAPSPPDASDAGTAADAYGYEDDAGNCVCPPGARPYPAPCCPPGYGACWAWPCYI
jgi:hypothetical protein